MKNNDHYLGEIVQKLKEVQRNRRYYRCMCRCGWTSNVSSFSLGFHKLDEIGNDANVGIRGFTT